jgi:phage terminase large subunit-like protein
MLSSPSSLASQLAGLPKSKLRTIIQSLSPKEVEQALYCWELWRRPSQTPPPGDWSVWLIKAGRGFGKTRIGAEWVRDLAESGKAKRIAIVARTASDHVKTTIEGESGILAVSSPWCRPKYIPSKCMIVWPTGTIAHTYTADEPDNLRGPQHDAAWADELAAWRYEDAWDQLMFGLRLGKSPRAVVTTTPRPTALIKRLMASPSTVTTHGSTYENKANLAPTFLEQIVSRYEGTRLGRQELYGEVLDDNPGALWNRSMIEASRVRVHPRLLRVVVAVDPAVSSNPDSDATGIGAAGLGEDGEVYVLEDATLEMAKPNEWGKETIRIYDKWEADRIVAEKNQGGDLVESNIRAQRAYVPYEGVHAKRSKALRAEPVAALYEQKKVHHVGIFPKLDDEMCDWNPTDTTAPSPNRVDWLVYAVTALLPGISIPITKDAPPPYVGNSLDDISLDTDNIEGI